MHQDIRINRKQFSESSLHDIFFFSSELVKKKKKEHLHEWDQTNNEFVKKMSPPPSLII